LFLSEIGDIMKGSIRAILGFIIVFGCVGGMDSASDTDLLFLLAVSAVGLAVMASGVKAIQENA
jgi:hypothetical protein